MLVSHLLLAIAWTVYCVLHSVLASVGVKQVLQKRTKSAFRFYRFIYTLFAFFGLVAVLYYQFTIYSVLLFSSPYWIQIIGGLFMTFGAVLMLMMIWKYFMQQQVRNNGASKIRSASLIPGHLCIYLGLVSYPSIHFIFDCDRNYYHIYFDRFEVRRAKINRGIRRRLY